MRIYLIYDLKSLSLTATLPCQIIYIDVPMEDINLADSLLYRYSESIDMLRINLTLCLIAPHLRESQWPEWWQQQLQSIACIKHLKPIIA